MDYQPLQTSVKFQFKQELVLTLSQHKLEYSQQPYEVVIHQPIISSINAEKSVYHYKQHAVKL